jgi:hypothetical protein
MKDVWKITPYDVIESKELDTKIPDKSASFLISIIIGTQYPQQNYHYLALINGGEKKLSKYGYNDMLAYCPINHWVDEKENTDCAYRVRNMVESMAQTMDIVQKNDIHGNPKKIAEGLEEQYNAKSPKIKKRTLLFCEESIGNKLTKDEVKGLYPYKMEVCSKAKLAEAIKDKSKDYYYLQLASTLNHFVFVIDPSNGEVMYGHFKTQGMAIKKDDLKDLLEAIDK